MGWNEIRGDVLNKIYPAKEELESARSLYLDISDFIDKQYGLETHFAGSTSRGTCMKGDKDIDIFVLFSERTSRKELEEKGLELGKEVFEEFGGNFEVDYAEHPYTKGEINGHEVEVVPCFDVDAEDIQSAVDRTPHHSKWVQENLDEDQREDVVILKKFLKEADLYGSSLKLRGFSGYLCEILISEFGSFQELVESAEDWSQEEVIDPEKTFEEGLPEELREKFSEDSLVVIDPVDSDRNVASVLSTENYARFVYRCWRFSREPSERFFFEEEEYDWTKFELKQEVQSRGDFISVRFDRPNEVDDLLYPQMRKFMRLMGRKLKKRDFRIFESGFYADETSVRFFFELESALPKVEELKGPMVFHNSKHLEQFTSKYENTFVKDRRLYAKTEREFTDAKSFMQSFLDEDVQGLKSKGVPSHIAEKVVEHSFFDVLEDDREWLNYLAEELNL
jgi:tRNA nucleotidyltransferase (CCA-adding enzyme)